MSRIDKIFQQIESEDRAALTMYLTVGFPDFKTSAVIAKAAIEAGVDIIELGVPYSDPLADGKTIQNASNIALANGINLNHCLDLTRQIREYAPDIPIILMGYFNPFLQYGLDTLAKDSLIAGVDGFIIPDLPPEESDTIDRSLIENQLDLIYLLAPTSTEERIQQVVNKTRAFIYCVSVAGVTGARDNISSEGVKLVEKVKTLSSSPVALGFGISTPEQVQNASRIADAVIVGSAFVDLISDNIDKELIRSVTGYIETLANSLSKKTSIPENNE